MKIAGYKCDVCGKEKGTVNHWYWMVVEDGLRLNRWDGQYWDESTQETISYGSRDAIHLCGAECVNKKVNEFLGGGK